MHCTCIYGWRGVRNCHIAHIRKAPRLKILTVKTSRSAKPVKKHLAKRQCCFLSVPKTQGCQAHARFIANGQHFAKKFLGQSLILTMCATVPQQIGKPAKSSLTCKFLSSFVSHRLAKYALRRVILSVCRLRSRHVGTVGEPRAKEVPDDLLGLVKAATPTTQTAKSKHQMWAEASSNDIACSYLSQAGCEARFPHSLRKEGLLYTYLLTSRQYET